MNISWAGQSTLGAADDRELVRLASESGCVLLFLGIERLSLRSLDASSKRMNRVDGYERRLRVLRGEDASVVAAMMFGFEGGGSSVFRMARDFLVRNRMAYSVWHPPVPLPGTHLRERLRREGGPKRIEGWLDPEMVAGFARRVLRPPRRRFLAKAVVNMALRRRVGSGNSVLER